MTEEQYLVTCLIEELSELQRELSKCLRFTKDHRFSVYAPSNLERAQLEFNDVCALVVMLNHDHGYGLLLDESKVDSKIDRVKQTMTISKELGVLDDNSDN